MTRSIVLDASPPKYRGMKDSLDRGAFRKSIQVLAARVPAVKAGLVLKSTAMKGFESSFSIDI